MSDRFTRHPRERHRGYLRVLEARSASTSPDRLYELAWDHIAPVRHWTARNPNTPPDALETLAHQPEYRWVVLHNPSTPERALRYLSDDEWRRNFLFVGHYGSFLIRERCYLHSNATADLKAELRRQGVVDSIRRLYPYGLPAWRDGRWTYEPIE